MRRLSYATGASPDPPRTAPGRRAFTVRPYRPQDRAAASGLYQQSFPGKRDPAEWIWKFGHRLTDSDPSFHVAEVDGRLVGLYPTRAVRLQIGASVRVAVQCEDVCVHPEHRGVAIMRAMVRANEESLRRARVALAFGFPTAAHLSFGSRFLGYAELFRLQVWHRRLARGLRVQAKLRSDWARRVAYTGGALLQNLRALRQPEMSDRTLRVAERRQFDVATDGLWDRVRGRLRAAVVRDAAYLTWRYSARPGRAFRVLHAVRHGRLDGYCVFRDDLVRSDRVRAGALMDLVATDRAAARALLEAALARMRAARCGYALALTHPAFETAPTLAAAGFAPEAAGETVSVCAKSYATDVDVNALREPSDWLLGYGDTDHLG